MNPRETRNKSGPVPPPTAGPPLRIAVLISGGGSTFANLTERIGVRARMGDRVIAQGTATLAPDPPALLETVLWATDMVPNTDAVRTITTPVNFEYTHNGTDWHRFAEISPAVWYVMPEPHVDFGFVPQEDDRPFLRFDLGLAKVLQYAHGAQSAPTLAWYMNRASSGIPHEIYYDPGAAIDDHILRAYVLIRT